MAQIEIYNFLKEQRQLNNDYFSAIQIHKCLNNNGFKIANRGGVYFGLIQLEGYGYLDVKKIGKLRDFKRIFRLKKKYLK